MSNRRIPRHNSHRLKHLNLVRKCKNMKEHNDCWQLPSHLRWSTHTTDTFGVPWTWSHHTKQRTLQKAIDVDTREASNMFLPRAGAFI